MPRSRRGRRGRASDSVAREELVLIDTNVWIAFEKGDPAVKPDVEDLAAAGAACFLPPVWFEFARGLPGPAARLEYTLSVYRDRFRFLPLADEDWETALRLARSAAPGPHAIQMTDALLAAAAVRTGAFVWSADPDLPRLRAADGRVRLFPAAV